MSHQSQSNNLPLSDNDNTLLAKSSVSGHSCSNNDDNNISNSTSNQLNFARVSLKTIKNKIKLNASYSLTRMTNNSNATTDTIIYNTNSIIVDRDIDSSNENKNDCYRPSDDNNKILIKSKSITDCMNDDDDDNKNVKIATITEPTTTTIKTAIDELPSSVCCDADDDENKINSISRDSVASSNVNAVPSSCSSTSNENNNEIVVKSSNGATAIDDNVEDDEGKLLNVSFKRNTNPFLSPPQQHNDVDCEEEDGLCNFGIGENRMKKDTAIGLINNIDFNTIPKCPFQRHDYKKHETYDDNIEHTRDVKKFLKLSKKSSHLFGKHRMVPSLKHVNLNYPNKTYIENGSDKKYLEKAKFQLIKLGQKCKILTHPQHSTSTLPNRHIRTTIIKTNSNSHKKYQYYNEINKSYQLDDFIRSTHLLHQHPRFDSVATSSSPMETPTAVVTTTETSNTTNDNNNDSVIYKSYKSEIDLTRNLTYLDAFLNEHFEHESNSPRNNNNSNKRIKINNGMMMIDEQRNNNNNNDGNVTSSSFEYTAMKKATKKDVQEIVSGKSSSLSSSDYASVYSGGSGSKVSSNDAKTKLISTPEESIEYYDANVIRQNKQKRLRSRRSSQPIPEVTNSYQDSAAVLFDEANFIELKNNMKKFHPDLYNSVPQFEDLNSVDFYENPQYPLSYYGDADDDDDDDGETLINPYARMNASPHHHQDYLEHYQQQLLDGHRPRAMTHSNYNEKMARDVYCNPTASTNDLHEKFSSQYHRHHPHRVIVSKSKKQKGEVVLEYEC